MTNRRTLVAGLTPAGTTASQLEKDFVFQGKTESTEVEVEKTAQSSPTSSTPNAVRAPISTRIRGDIAMALKRASLQRQLDNIEPNAISDILETALEPWLQSNGYLP